MGLGMCGKNVDGIIYTIVAWAILVKLLIREWHTWWRHQIETSSALLAICAGNSPVPGEFPTQRPVTRSFNVFFDLCLNKRLSKQSWGWWLETIWRPLWHHCNENLTYEKSKLVRVTAWCHQATSHYLCQFWHIFISPYGITMPQWVKQWLFAYSIPSH